MTIPFITEKCPLTVNASKRDGLGVFANRNIRQGEKLCYFDGEERPITDIYDGNSVGMARRWDDHSDVLRLGYHIPRTEWGIGQYINDACKPDLEFIVEHSLSKQHKVSTQRLKCEFEVYERKSKNASMVTMGSHYWFLAGRDIRIGEEVVMHYGKGFWAYWYISGSCNHLPLYGQTYSVLRISLAALMDPTIYTTLTSKGHTHFEALLSQLMLVPFFELQCKEVFSQVPAISRRSEEQRRVYAFEFLCKALLE